MTAAMLLALTLLSPGARPDPFDVQAELHGLYEEISQASLQFVTESDIDLFHDVLYTPDWVFVDAAGQKQTWSQVRERAVQALGAPLPDSITQSIRHLSLEADGATAVVTMTTVRTVVDHEGRYGRPGGSHTLTEATLFRDRWVRVDDAWKLNSREQIGSPTVSVDKPEPNT